MSDTILVAILAAGRSSRFGSDKLAAKIGGMTLGERAVKLARSTGQPIIWIGSGQGWEPSDCEVVLNPLADHGMGTSVALAAKIAAERKSDAFLILLADMPMVNAELLQEMLIQGAPICCRYPDGNPGPPALLPAAYYAELRRLADDTGARHMLKGLPCLAFLDPPDGALSDIDCPDDLATLHRRWSG
jgi:molybdenum cofactor cytidylyltransferase